MIKFDKEKMYLVMDGKKTEIKGMTRTESAEVEDMQDEFGTVYERHARIKITEYLIEPLDKTEEK